MSRGIPDSDWSAIWRKQTGPQDVWGSQVGKQAVWERVAPSTYSKMERLNWGFNHEKEAAMQSSGSQTPWGWTLGRIWESKRQDRKAGKILVLKGVGWSSVTAFAGTVNICLRPFLFLAVNLQFSGNRTRNLIYRKKTCTEVLMQY